MTKNSIKRTMILLAMGASTFGFFGTSFGPSDMLACNYAMNSDYDSMYEAAGHAVINTVSDGLFGNIGTDFDNVVRTPTTTFARATWSNWLDARIPDDLPNNGVTLR